MKTKKLKRNLSLPLVTLYGLGNILGAGIYVLVGKVAGNAGLGTPLAFLIAMVIAGLTAFSYMELSSRYPVSASVSMYLHQAFGKKLLSLGVGLLMVAGGVASAAVLSKGFAGYLQAFIAVPELVASAGLLIFLGAVAAKGIGESAKLAAIFTFIEIAGLLLVIWLGRASLGNVHPNQFLQVDPILGISGAMTGAFLAFYAFIGFEDMVNIAEEVKKPRRTMPLAILISLIVSTILYLLVVLVSMAAVSPAELANSSAPLSLVVGRSSTMSTTFISAIGVAAAVNGTLVQIIMGSRILYGLARRGWVHRDLAKLHKTNQTPAMATALVVSVMLAATLLLPLLSLAKLTSFLILAIFFLVNSSLVVLKARSHKIQNGVVYVPKFVPVLGALSCLGILLFEIAR